MAIIDMYNESKQNNVVPIKNIASRQNLSIYYLEQLFSLLKKSNIVKSIKGPGGGYIFEIQPENLRLIDILKAVGENVEIAKCTLENKASCKEISQAKCNSHDLWANMTAYLRQYLQSTTIQDAANKNFFFKTYEINSH